MAVYRSMPGLVYIGNTLRAEAIVKSARARRSMAELEFVVKNQDGELVLEREALVLQDAGGR